jgi:hypothetical protein
MISMTCWRRNETSFRFASEIFRFASEIFCFASEVLRFASEVLRFASEVFVSQAKFPRRFAGDFPETFRRESGLALDVGDLASDDANLLCVQALDTRGYPLFRPTAGL